MPLAANALTAVATAKKWLRNTPGLADDVIEILINSASDSIAGYCERELMPGVDDETRYFPYSGGGRLNLAPFDLRSVSSIVLGSDLPTDSQRTLLAQTATQESEYRLEPRRRTPEGTYLWIALPRLARRDFAVEVAVTGDWGVGYVPADAEEACLICVAEAYRNPESLPNRTLGEFVIGEAIPTPEEAGDSIPRRARFKLRRLKRMAV